MVPSGRREDEATGGELGVHVSHEKADREVTQGFVLIPWWLKCSAMIIAISQLVK